jgi:hypothetical protein
MKRTRQEMLDEIERRMRENRIFYPDIWARVLQTSTKVLEEILAGNFERQVLDRLAWQGKMGRTT